MESLSCALWGYLEILDKTGRVTSRTPVRSHQLRIGRAFDNDVIVDDPYVCPYHAQLVVDEGQPKMIDLESVNGVTDPAGRPLPATVPLVQGHVVHLGRTPFRYRAIDHPLEPTLRDTRKPPLQWLHKPFFLGLVFFLTLATILLETYIGSTDEFELLKQAPALLGILVVIVLWAMLWSFASRVVAHRWNFWSFCGIACLGILLSTLAENASEYLCFALAQDSALPWFNYGNQFLLSGAVLYLNLQLISSVSRVHLARFAGGIALALVVVTWGVKYAQQDHFSSGPEYHVTLKAPPWKLSRGLTTEEFFARGDMLLQELEKVQTAD